MSTKKQLSDALKKANIAYDILQSKYNTILESYTDSLLEASTLRRENERLKTALNIVDIPTQQSEKKPILHAEWVAILRDNE